MFTTILKITIATVYIIRSGVASFFKIVFQLKSGEIPCCLNTSQEKVELRAVKL